MHRIALREKSALALLVSLLVLQLTGCQQSHGIDGGPPLYDGMGAHTRTITTTSPLAQRYFNQGLALVYGFNHDEAIRAFREAGRLDPDCAMAWWGVALCYGPHINFPMMDAEKSRLAVEALEQARRCAAHAAPVEQALIAALAQRYSNSPPEDRRPLDEAYAAAMRAVWAAYPNDADVGTLFAESMMNLRPWDLWTLDGAAQPGTEEIVSTLETVMRLNPQHPGANHLYIHAVEASRTPERGLASAERLRTLVPGAGHLVHMPAHIYLRTGQYQRAATANEEAIAADQRYRRLAPKQGFYLAYMLHNHHFLAFAAMMEGRSEAAIEAARATVASVPDESLREAAPLLDPYLMIPYEALMRFGRWEQILREPPPPACLPITGAFWRFTRGVALAALGDVGQARAEQAAFRAITAALPKDALMAINPAHDVLRIADLVLDAEIDYRRGEIDAAVATLRTAARHEDALRYMEPPDWVHPVRHILGAFLVEAHRYEEAEAVYRDDLARWPDNGWALHGLGRCLRARGALAEAADVERRFERAWARADTKLASSCLCVARD